MGLRAWPYRATTSRAPCNRRLNRAAYFEAGSIESEPCSAIRFAAGALGI
jgi:hypothetical protein